MKGNKGEWSEVYVFLKLLIDGRIYAADKDLNKIPTAFLNILKIIREEVRGKCYGYVPGKTVARIFLNGKDTGETCRVETLTNCRNFLWQELNKAHGGNGAFAIPSVYEFIKTLHLISLKAPAFGGKKLYGGTVDITMQVEDPKTSLVNEVGFSCKSDFAASSTLFNASSDNTNFEYVVKGGMTDALMDEFNDIWVKNKDGSFRLTKNGDKQIATAERMQFLKDHLCSVRCLGACTELASANLTMSAGMEAPDVVGEMLRFFYFENRGSREHGSMRDAIDNLIQTNPVGYRTQIDKTYRKRVRDLLYDMFTGMRLGEPWDGSHSVNGGYIVVKPDGDVLAYHTCLEDAFKNFLVENLGFEAPSGGRHGCMQMFRAGNEYHIKFGLQIRFYRRHISESKLIDRLHRQEPS